MPSLFTINSSVLSIILTKNAKIAESYTFNATGKTITVNEPDFKRLLYVIDKDNERILFNPLKAGSNQNININLNYDSFDLLKTDELLVIYEAQENNQVAILLEAILEQQIEQTKYLKKIYQ